MLAGDDAYKNFVREGGTWRVFHNHTDRSLYILVSHCHNYSVTNKLKMSVVNNNKCLSVIHELFGSRRQLSFAKVGLVAPLDTFLSLLQLVSERGHAFLKEMAGGRPADQVRFKTILSLILLTSL